jgi:AbrB family looped-hinge helix DNA binding protein
LPCFSKFKEVLTLSVPIVDNAKVMAKGQITLPKDIRSKLRLSTGDRVTLICEEDRVILMNSAIYAMKMLRQEMKGEAEKAGIQTDDDVMALVKDVRAEIEGL